jgi:tRNA-splicing ligase RtcB
MKIITTGKTPIYAWVDGVEFDDTARKQLEAIASLPIVYHHVAAMPDVHAVKGATVGSVIPTLAAIVPAAFEKDVGKVMKAQADLVAIVHAMRQVICIKG